MNLNKVMLIGRLGKNPEVNYFKPDAAVAKFSLATSEYYVGKNGEKIENTEWHNIVAWHNNAKFAEKYLTKGMLVYIEGKISTKKWDKNDGITRYSTEIIAEDIKILEKKQDNQDNIQNTSNLAEQNPNQTKNENDSHNFADESLQNDDDMPSSFEENDLDDLPF